MIMLRGIKNRSWLYPWAFVVVELERYAARLLPACLPQLSLVNRVPYWGYFRAKFNTDI